MKYFIIHVTHGRRDGEGYTVLIEIDNGTEETAVEQMIEKGYVDWIEDISDIGYVREIPFEEYQLLKSKTAHNQWKSGCMLGEKYFAEEDLALAKKLSYENWEKEETQVGFEFHGQWITNPFVDASGRFEFVDLAAMYDYYSKDDDGRYEDGKKEKVYEFILKILGLDIYLD